MCDHDHDGIDWENITLAGALAEETAEKERESEQTRREIERGITKNYNEID